MIWKTPIDLEKLNQTCENTLSHFLGIQFTHVDHNSLTATMHIQKHHMQPMGIMHGGASCVLAETIGSVAAHFCVDPSNKRCVGLDININHLRQVVGGILTAVTTPLHLGKTTQVWEIKIWNEFQKLIAISRLTIAVIDQKVIS